MQMPEVQALDRSALAYNGTNDRRTRMPTFEELVPKQRGIDAKLARGIEEDHDWHWVEGSSGYEPSTSVKDGWTIVAFALPQEFPSVEAVEHFVEADSPQVAMDKLVAYLYNLGFRGEVRVTD